MTAPLTSWVEVPVDSDFPIQNLPYGVFTDSRGTRCCVAIGESVVDLAAAERSGMFSDTGLEAETFSSDSLNTFIGQDRAVWVAVRTALPDFLVAGNSAAQTFAK